MIWTLIRILCLVLFIMMFIISVQDYGNNVLLTVNSTVATSNQIHELLGGNSNETISSKYNCSQITDGNYSQIQENDVNNATINQPAPTTIIGLCDSVMEKIRSGSIQDMEISLVLIMLLSAFMVGQALQPKKLKV